MSQNMEQVPADRLAEVRRQVEDVRVVRVTFTIEILFVRCILYAGQCLFVFAVCLYSAK